MLLAFTLSVDDFVISSLPPVPGLHPVHYRLFHGQKGINPRSTPFPH